MGKAARKVGKRENEKSGKRQWGKPQEEKAKREEPDKAENGIWGKQQDEQEKGDTKKRKTTMGKTARRVG